MNDYMSNEKKAQRMLESLVNNDDLNRYELQGFIRGFSKGKTMNVNLHVIFQSVNKQYLDFCRAWGKADQTELKRTSADLRNVAGLFFLKLMETEKMGTTF